APAVTGNRHGCSSRRIKILLIDDHAIVRSGLRRLLASLGNPEISEAANGRDALVRYREARQDVVILDFNLPGIGGLELLQRLMIDDPAARVLGFSMLAAGSFCPAALHA